jgi:hypothetical protein
MLTGSNTYSLERRGEPDDGRALGTSSLRTIEEEIRECEQRGDCGPTFVEPARSASERDDHQVSIERRITERPGCDPLIDRTTGTDRMIRRVYRKNMRGRLAFVESCGEI